MELDNNLWLETKANKQNNIFFNPHPAVVFSSTTLAASFAMSSQFLLVWLTSS